MNNGLMLFEGDRLVSLYKATDTLAKSSMIPYHLRGKSADIFAILTMGQELGIAPMQSLQAINVIQGKPTVSPQLMIALVRSKFPNALIDIKIDEENQSVTCRTARDLAQSEFAYIATWNMTKAQAMGLSGKDNYTKQATNMLKWRAVAESFRVTFPDVLMGLYAPEEFQDFSGKEIRTVLNEKEELEQDFPIPEEEKESGAGTYRVQNGKLRGKQLKDVVTEEMEDYVIVLEKRLKKDGKLKPWEDELYTSMISYLEALNADIVDER